MYRLTRSAALAAGLALATAACAGTTMNDDDVHGYSLDDAGNPVAAFVFSGWDERNCAQYRLEPMQDDVAVPAVMYVWDGEQFTTDQDACKPGVAAQ